MFVVTIHTTVLLHWWECLGVPALPTCRHLSAWNNGSTIDGVRVHRLMSRLLGAERMWCRKDDQCARFTGAG